MGDALETAPGHVLRERLEHERFLTCGDVRAGFVEVTCETWAMAV
jgi:hypothetical protein